MKQFSREKLRLWRKRLLWVLAGFALLLVIAGIGIAAILGSQGGRLWLLNTGIDLGLGDGPLQVKVEQARSPSLGEWSFARVVVTRDDDVWLDIRELHLDWRPSELLQSRLLVDSLGAKTVDFYADAGTPADKPEQPKEQGQGLPTLPPIAVDAFELGRLNIVSESLQLPDYQIAGEVRLFWPERPFELELTVESLPEPDGYAVMQLQLSSSAQTPDSIKLEGSVTEAAGGKLGELLRLPKGSAIDARFAGVVDTQEEIYDISLETLEFPFLQHQLGANGHLKVARDWQTVDIEQLQLRTDQQQHSLSGTASQEDIDLRLETNEFPLDLISPWVEQIQQGSVSSQLHITGTPTQPQISGQLSGTTRYQDYPVNIDVAGDFSRQQLVFERLKAGFGTASAQAKGRLDLEGANSDLQFQVQDFPGDYLSLANVELPPELEARIIKAEGQLTGHYLDPNGQIELSGKGRYRDQPFSLKVDAEGNQRKVTLSPAVLRLGDAQVAAEGTLDIQGDSSSLELTFEQVPTSLVELAGVELPADFAAELSGTANLSGSVEQPSVRLAVQADGRFRQQDFDMQFRGSGNREALVVERARIQVGAASLRADGTMNILGKETDLEVHLDKAPLSLLELAQIEVPEGLEAEVSGSALVTGALPLPQIRGDLTMAGSYDEVPFRFIANGSFIDRRIALEQVHLNLDGVTALEAHGFLEPDAYDLSLSINDLPTRTLSALGWNLVTGDFNGDLRIQGTPDTPQIAGDFSYVGEVTGIDLATGEETTFQLGWHTQLQTEEQVLGIVSEFTRNKRETGTLEIQVPLTDYLAYFSENDGGALPLDFVADGALDLTVLSLVLDPDVHRINGRAALRMEGDGTLENPDLTGVFELLNARYENTLTGTLLTDIQLLLKSEGTRLTIVDGSARGKGSGRITAEGMVDWGEPENDKAVDVRIEAKNANLIDREDLDGEINGDLSLVGSFQELWLKGEVNVSPFSANIDAALQSQIPEIEVTEVYGDPEEEEALEAGASLAPTINLDVVIQAKQQAYLRGRGLEAELAGEIHLTGTLQNPNYQGEFSILRGVFEVFGRKFTLQQGEVIFANNALYMTIPGVWQFEDYTIRAELQGTVEDLKLNLSSVPDLPDDEILSLLIFGKSAQSITPFQALRLATAIQTLRGGGGGFDPIGSTRDALGVDTLSVESGAGSGVAVGVGKYINERVYLEVKRTPSETEPWQGSVEIELTPRLHLKSSTGGEGQAGAELLWKRDY